MDLCRKEGMENSLSTAQDNRIVYDLESRVRPASQVRSCVEQRTTSLGTCFIMDSATYLPGPNLLITAENHILDESTRYTQSLFKALASVQYSFAPPKFSLFSRKPLLFATGFWQYGYWHWVTETLTRVLIAKEAGFDGIVLFDGLGFQRESLVALGFNEEDLFATKEPISAREFWVPQNVMGSSAHERRKVFQRLMSTLSVPSPFASRRLFIDRTNAGNGRDIVNKRDVLDLSSAFEFEVLHPSGMSFQNQLTHYGQAKVLLGAHGAGMANTLFMPAGGYHIECFSSNYRNECNRELAGVAGHRCIPLFDESHAQRADYSPFVNSEQLQETLKSVVNR